MLCNQIRTRALLAVGLLLTVISHTAAQDSLRKGMLSGEWRTYYQSTHNQGTLKDFYGLATGGKLGFQYAFTPNLRAGTILYTSVNLGIQDLTIPDATTGKGSRYEKALFDLQDLNDRWIVLPGELYLHYTPDKHDLRVGRLKVESPFINPQDGRMIPTLGQGIWYQYRPSPEYTLQLGWLNAIAPRATQRFYAIGESIGQHSVGRNPDGSPSQYAGHTQSDYIMVAGLSMQPWRILNLELWDYFAQNIFHTLYLKPTLHLKNMNTAFSLEWLHQDREGEGGNAVDSLRYFSGKHANVLGVQLTQKLDHTAISLGYDHVLKGDRFLFPREWGRESLFTVQKRERTEGSANNHAVVLTYERLFSFKKQKLQTVTSLGHQWRPSVHHPAENKYGIPDYTHINLDLFYQHTHESHLKPEMLLTYKWGHHNVPDDPGFVLNKVNMFQINMIVNYHF